MILRRLKNFANARIITGTLTTTIMVLSVAWFIAEGGYEPAIASVASIAGFIGFFQYSFMSFDKNLTTDRIALVVGNQNYQNTPPLQNSINDAEAVCKSLKNKGFKIIKRIDPSTNELRKAIYDFQTILSTGGVGLFYYSGHAAQIQGRDYILPVDAHLESKEEFPDKAIDLNDLLGPVDQIIDESPDQNGSIVIYSTASGSVAFDFFKKPEEKGTEEPEKPEESKSQITTSTHSPFADAFLSLSDKWNLEIFDLFRELLKRVRSTTDYHQIPWLSASVDTEFYFKPIVKENIGILKLLVFDACRNDPFYRPPIYYYMVRDISESEMQNAQQMR